MGDGLGRRACGRACRSVCVRGRLPATSVCSSSHGRGVLCPVAGRGVAPERRGSDPPQPGGSLPLRRVGDGTRACRFRPRGHGRVLTTTLHRIEQAQMPFSCSRRARTLASSRARPRPHRALPGDQSERSRARHVRWSPLKTPSGQDEEVMKETLEAVYENGVGLPACSACRRASARTAASPLR